MWRKEPKVVEPSPVAEAYDYISEKVSSIEDLVMILNGRLSMVLVEGKPIEPTEGEKEEVGEDLSLISTQLGMEGDRLARIETKLNNILDRLEL